jgi:ppGpp synthetase/RelA/SpoT-type nucleotidyltranferase
MSIIDSFLQRFAKEYDYYYELARQVASICETLLHRNGIRAIVTYRAKKPDSLREKLNKRHEWKNYKSIEQIYKDIVDLAGVRIATYFPGDREEIGKLIESEFITKKVKMFPNNEQKNPASLTYKKKFAGYDAMHYRVNIKEDKLDDSFKRYTQAQVEIQIASALMHSWAEVEHDLAYKPKIGSLSEEEFIILDELNGLVLSGEIALERLQKAFKSRISAINHQFNNHYELAALIREKVNIPDGSLFCMGRVDILLRFMQKIKIDNPQMINPFLQKISTYKYQNTIVDKFVDLILDKYPDYYKQYIEAKNEIKTHNPYSPIERYSTSHYEHKVLDNYISHWIAIEKVIDIIAISENSQTQGCLDKEINLKSIYAIIGCNEDIVHDTKYLYSLRNQVMFSNDIPGDGVLKDAVDTLDKMITLLISRTDVVLSNKIKLIVENLGF